jgi:hypothetical protein
MPPMPADMRQSDCAKWFGRAWRLMLSGVISISLTGPMSGCAKARAQAEPSMPELAVPPPPPRVLPPLEGEPIDAAVPAPTEPQARPRPRQRPDSARAGGNGARPDTRTDGGTVTPAPVEPSAPPEAESPAQSTPALQLAPAGDAASEQNTRRRLVQAERDLQQVDYRLLNADAKAQYDYAKRFITMAEQAIVERNLLFARKLADKAATIAALLQRR